MIFWPTGDPWFWWSGRPRGPRDPLRSTGPAPRVNLHKKSAPETNSKAISRRSPAGQKVYIQNPGVRNSRGNQIKSAKLLQRAQLLTRQPQRIRYSGLNANAHSTVQSETIVLESDLTFKARLLCWSADERRHTTPTHIG